MNVNSVNCVCQRAHVWGGIAIVVVVSSYHDRVLSHPLVKVRMAGWKLLDWQHLSRHSLVCFLKQTIEHVPVHIQSSLF